MANELQRHCSNKMFLPNFNSNSRHPLCLFARTGNNNKKANRISMLPVNPLSLLLFQEFTIEMGFCTFFKLLLESIWECVMRWTEISFKRSYQLKDSETLSQQLELGVRLDRPGCTAWKFFKLPLSLPVIEASKNSFRRAKKLIIDDN